jgi:hypothetical protein
MIRCREVPLRDRETKISGREVGMDNRNASADPISSRTVQDIRNPQRTVLVGGSNPYHLPYSQYYRQGLPVSHVIREAESLGDGKCPGAYAPS